MKDFLVRYKVAVSIIIALLIIVLVAYFMGRKSQKSTNQVEIPSDTKKALTSEEETKVKYFADNLYNDMKGANWSHDINLWNEWLYTTDRIFIGTANHFNQKYGQSESLYQWVSNETNMNSFLWTTKFGSYQAAILTRMKSLNLA